MERESQANLFIKTWSLKYRKAPHLVHPTKFTFFLKVKIVVGTIGNRTYLRVLS